MIQAKIKRIILASIMLSAVIIVMAAPDVPSIDSWINNKTNNNALEIEINVSESVRFDATANQTIDTWRWFIDGKDQKNDADNFITRFDSEGDHEVRVDATNNSNTSLPITWKVHVVVPVQETLPVIISWLNNKTINDSQDFTINISESVLFNATADQTIDT